MDDSLIANENPFISIYADIWIAELIEAFPAHEVYDPKTYENIYIRKVAYQTMINFRQLEPGSLEAGGVLLGSLHHDDHHFIRMVTTPMLLDRRSRYGLNREDPGHQQAINEALEKSGHCIHFYGDWHTHAELDPTPSPIDIEGWRITSAESTSDYSFHFIVGQKYTRLWRMDKGQLEPRQINTHWLNQ